MWQWYFGKKIERAIDEAKSVFENFRNLIRTGTPELVVLYAEGIGEAADLIAQRYGISAQQAIEGTGLSFDQGADAFKVLEKAMEAVRPYLKSENKATYVPALKIVAGGSVFTTLYRLLGLKAMCTQESRKASLAEAAETYVRFARFMAEIRAGDRSPDGAIVMAELGGGPFCDGLP
jgi:hypothetical protein